MNLSDYYLVKCFETAEYRECFNNGSNIYINSLKHFWELENTFQQDFEGLVFQQSGKGYYFVAKPEFKELVKKGINEGYSLEKLKRRAIEEGVGKVECETTGTALWLDGYICCFYLLPKSAVSFNKTTLSIISENERKDIACYLENCLNNYLNEDFYVSIYDAKIFCDIFCKGMISKGYSVEIGFVGYEDVDTEQKIKWFQERNFKAIAFTKPTKYSYQKEFRIYVSKHGHNNEDHISESGIEIYKSILGSFDYNMIMHK